MTDIQSLLVLGLGSSALIASAFTLVIGIKSIKDFSHAGPQIEGVIRKHYLGYVAYSLARLFIWTWVINWCLSYVGVIIVIALSAIVKLPIGFGLLTIAAGIGWGVLLSYAFIEKLYYQPGTIASNSNYRMSRFYRVWRVLTEDRLRAFRQMFQILYLGSVTWAVCVLWLQGRVTEAVTLLLVSISFAAIANFHSKTPEPEHTSAGESPTLPNIVMIGCDTLRADRLGVDGYNRPLTPTLDRIAREGVYFSNCFVPIPRTAPSLLSLFSGVWPQTHGVRDNFTSVGELRQGLEFLPSILSVNGYRTKAVSDWSGCDFSKFEFGFEELDCPEDQWNLKYLIRQGPKDLRLFLSLFCGGRFGKRFLPELYYLAGTPMTTELGTEARRFIKTSVEDGKPFFLNMFSATAHPPFSVEFPYYLKYVDENYDGESKFSMSKLTDPMEIIAAQQRPKESFDMNQIKNLYDGCVNRFDDEVSRILGYIEGSELRENTIILIYSDHGIELFENDSWGQGNSIIGDYSARIPMVISDPRCSPQGVKNSICRVIDIAPTVLDLLGIDIPESLEGVSLADYVRGKTPDKSLCAYTETGIWIAKQPNSHPAHVDYPNILKLIDVTDYESGTLEIKDEYKKIVVTARDRIVRRGKWALTYTPLKSGVEMKLFDVTKDPNCRSDLSEEYPDVAGELANELENWL